MIVGVSGSPGSLQALRRAVAEARLRGASVWSVIAWTPPGGESAERRAPSPYLARVWQQAAMDILRSAWDEALGGLPGDLPVRLLVLRGHTGRRLTRLADREDDVLVLGAGTGGALRRLVAGSVRSYCVQHARCAVPAVPPTPLERQLAHRPLGGRRMLRQLASHA